MASPTIVRDPVRRPAEHEAGGRRLAPRPGPRRAALVVVIGYLVTVATLVLSGLLLTHVLVHGRLGRWDESSTRWLSLHRHGGLDTMTGLLTRSADTLGIIVAALAVLVLLATRHRWTQMAVLVTALVLELSAFLAVNAVIGRDRPAVVRLGSTPSTSSFPSGHTAATLVLYGAIALFVSATVRAFVWRALAWLAAAVMPVIVGFARVYRGFHHPTDVFFGLVLGIAALLVAVLAVRRWTPARARQEVQR